MTIFGRRDTWAIELEPLAGPPPESDPAAAATWCAIRIWANGRNLSAHTRKDTMAAAEALHWPAAYLARWFVYGWHDLWERAGWPLAGAVVDAEDACSRLDARLAQLGDDVDDDLLDRRDAFVQSHTMLAAAGGGVMPPVYLMREGAKVHVVWRPSRSSDSAVVVHEQSGRTAIDTEGFLQTIAGFIGWCRDAVRTVAPRLHEDLDTWLTGLESPRAAEAVLAGYVRPWGVPDSFAPLPDVAATLGLPQGWNMAGARLDPSRMPAAVVFRALAPVIQAQDLQLLLARLRSRPMDESASMRLAALSDGLHISRREAPHYQGYALAEELRARLGNIDESLDVEAVMRDLGIALEDDNLSDASVDAATVWDDAHGPVVIINTLGIHNTHWARRMTLAHELCHLLVDRERGAALMIASTPWAPPELERRANAFAAELLLPKAGILRVAATALRTGRMDDMTRQVLMTEFQVGETVCNHQLANRLKIDD